MAGVAGAGKARTVLGLCYKEGVWATSPFGFFFETRSY